VGKAAKVGVSHVGVVRLVIAVEVVGSTSWSKQWSSWSEWCTTWWSGSRRVVLVVVVEVAVGRLDRGARLVVAAVVATVVVVGSAAWSPCS
jgi:hypothetical protein